MTASKKERLHGWGGFPAVACLSFRPEKQRDLQTIVEAHAGKLLARGMGRAYGDAALQPEGVIRTERLDHFIAFDDASGIVRAQAGLSLSELMNISIPRGWLPPVIPGTRHVTLGGAFACNIHGKNHWQEGDFAEHVSSIRLTLAGGESIECSATERPDIFFATAGGMGMTGIIEEVTLKLKPIASASLKSTAFQVDYIKDMLDAFGEHRGSADYMIGWIDHMAGDKELGRGVFEAASHISADEGGAPLAQFQSLKTKCSVPFFLPSFVLNRYSMALYNRHRFKKYSGGRKTAITGFNDFFHPLDTIGHWNRLYGKRGFFQYQCILPETPDIAEKLHDLLSIIHQHKCFSFLAVIKYHRAGQGLLTFSIPGYSIALDFPNTKKVRVLLPQLDRFVADSGGRIYLAKDALLAPEMFRAMYGQSATQWTEAIRALDPDSKFTSLMSQRLAWKR